jgi:hypothetical protein
MLKAFIDAFSIWHFNLGKACLDANYYLDVQ